MEIIMDKIIKYWVYSIEKFIAEKKEWITEKRYFRGEILLNDYSLKDVEGKRRNAKFLEVTEKPPFKNN